VWLGLVATLAVTVASCSERQANDGPRPRESVRVGETAPDFTLPSADGTDVSLSALKGRRVLLYFSMGPG
jgi:cytochrome oxidase Cu insertion factor (SCO1/SenC/PrrC family)